MKVLVTGGAGFIGSHIVDRLIIEGHDVRILDNLEPRVHPKGRPAWIPNDVEFIQGDVRDKGALASALDGVHVVFHQAAYQDYMLDFSKFFHVNSVSTAMIHELILAENRDLPRRARTVEKIIVASSQAVYGEGQYRCGNEQCARFAIGVVQAETRSLAQLQMAQWELLCPDCRQPMKHCRLKEEYHNPYNAYAISKLAEEMAAVRLGKLHGIPTVGLRYSIVQGPRQSLYNQYSGICRIFCLRLLNNVPPVIYEDGLQRRDYTHIADVVEANMLALRDRKADYGVFNVGSGFEITVREYADLLIRKLAKQIEPVLSGEYRLGDNRHSVSDVSKIMALGWAPRYGLNEIFDHYLGWIGEQGNLSQYFREAEETMRRQGVLRKAFQ